ncbi:hypothetical protein RJ641_027527 [Dillenia turbinata]|uniref:Uncharacterized protein n=1 Tax=Dillenia turbinata TaxID=194707 RepID=A0AAN8ZQG2_9MAGN
MRKGGAVSVSWKSEKWKNVASKMQPKPSRNLCLNAVVYSSLLAHTIFREMEEVTSDPEPWHRLDNKVVTVTDAPSGIGWEFCIDLAAAG